MSDRERARMSWSCRGDVTVTRDLCIGPNESGSSILQTPGAMRILPLLLASLLLASCTAVHRTTPVAPMELHTNYRIGDDATYEVRVGEAMFDVERSARLPTYESVDHYSPIRPTYEIVRPWPHIAPGMRFVALYERDEGELGLEIDEEFAAGMMNDPIVRNWQQHARPPIWILPDGTTSMIEAGWPPLRLFRPATEPVRAGRWFRAVLALLSVRDDTLRAEYREYHDGTPRSESARELAFDLAASRIIEHRGIRMEVVAVGSGSVTLRVVGDDGLAWVAIDSF